VPPSLRPLRLDPESIGRLDPSTREVLHNLPPKIKAQMQAHGTAMVGFQPIEGLNTFRMIFMNPNVTTQDIDAVLEFIDEYSQTAATAKTGS